jgi:hypothetical protein
VSKNMHRFTVFTQPKGSPSPAVLGVLPRRVAWTNKKADGKYRILLQMPYPETSEGNCHGMEDPPHLVDWPSAAVVQEAKNICHACPIKKQCKAWGIAHEKYYIYGGLTADEREEIRERLNIQQFDPIHGFNYAMNDNPYEWREMVCERGHGLDERDLVRVNNLVDDPYRHVYQVQCTQCWWDSNLSDEARARQAAKGRIAAKVIAERGTRNTSNKNKWGA